MNQQGDELRKIWAASEPSPPVEVEAVLARINQKSNGFRRMIARRDLREMAAGVVVAILFGYFAYRSADWLVRGSDLWIAAGGLWIVYWLRRHSYVLRDPERDQSVGGYYRALSDSYERQVWLLRTAKLWYLLPLWSGLMLFSFATWRMHRNIPELFVLIATFTLTFGFVWWLNESWGVKYLRRKQAELAMLVRNGEEKAR